jgi:hypothetical protein
MPRWLLLAVLLAGVSASPAPRPSLQEPDVPLEGFLAALERALRAPTPESLRSLLLVADPREADAIVRQILDPEATRVTVKVRDRRHLSGALPGEGYSLWAEMLVERGRAGRIATWRIDVRLTRGRGEPAGEGRVWRVVGAEPVATLDGLYRLALTPTKQFAVRNLVVQSVDLRLEVPHGDAFVAETEQGITALVVRGRGEMRFAPAPEAERAQVRIFAGAEPLVAAFDALYLRVNPARFAERVTADAFVERPVDPRALRRAQELFDAHVGDSFALKLGDLSPDTWSLAPPGDDCLAEVHTRRFGVLTYARSSGEPEDVTLFLRGARRNIASYASPEKLAARGRFYNEDELADLDVLDYRVDVRIAPGREWIEGETTVRLRVRAPAVSTVTLRLDEALAVRSVASPQLGRLLHLRVVGQNNLIVNLPWVLTQGSEVELTVAYGGRLPPQPIEREALAVTADQAGQERQAMPLFETVIPPEPYYLYSNRAHWYPRGPSGDYATATLRVTVPADYTCVATGLAAVGSPLVVPARPPETGTWRVHVFVANQPVRYLACLVSRLVDVDTASIALLDEGAAPVAGDEARVGTVTFALRANARQVGRSRALRDRATAILRYYTSILGEAPYPGFSLVVVDALLPGGHSPAYFALLHQPLPTSPFRWENDPVSFEAFPAFFLAHEVAHQWWGQAVGWQNYHEQWLSEGLAQYFAVLYAAHTMGPEALGDLMRQMHRWTMRYTDEGPIWLGYRLGHVRGESRIFRAIVYNKSAMVLHMLRRLVGDERFFAGLARFYREFKFRKAGTDEFRRVMEQESGLPLERFFERWIFGARLPRLRVSWRVVSAADPTAGRGALVLRVEQEGEVFDVPLTVTLTYASGARRSLVIPVTERVVERTVALEDRLARVTTNDDFAALAEIVR